MRSTICAACFVLVSLLAAGLPRPAFAESQIDIAYEAPTDAALRPIYDQLRQQGVLQELQLFMEPLRLPRELVVKTAQCGPKPAPYAAGGPVVVCYEALDQVAKLVAQHSRDPAYQQTLIYGAFIETVLHEMAVAIFDELAVPVWGREYDAADRLAALIMTQFGEDVMRTTIESTTQIFQWSDKRSTGRDFAAAAGRLTHSASTTISASPLPLRPMTMAISCAAARCRANGPIVATANISRSRRPSISGSCPMSIQTYW